MEDVDEQWTFIGQKLGANDPTRLPDHLGSTRNSLRTSGLTSFNPGEPDYTTFDLATTSFVTPGRCPLVTDGKS